MSEAPRIVNLKAALEEAMRNIDEPVARVAEPEQSGAQPVAKFVRVPEDAGFYMTDGYPSIRDLPPGEYAIYPGTQDGLAPADLAPSLTVPGSPGTHELERWAAMAEKQSNRLEADAEEAEENSGYETRPENRAALLHRAASLRKLAADWRSMASHFRDLRGQGTVQVAAQAQEIRNAYAIYVIHGDDWWAVQTIRDGAPITAELVTSRPMTDKELGRTLRRAFEQSTQEAGD